jgi:hypothetical protein
MKVKVIGCLDARTILCAVLVSGAILCFGRIASAASRAADGKRAAK